MSERRLHPNRQARTDGEGLTPGRGRRTPKAPFLPRTRRITGLRRAAASCRGCDLYRYATQTVFGQGAPDARVVLVGEQPGDQEDRKGVPFVGPTGALLRRALAETGISGRDVYLSNAVKHFKFEPRGKRRIHKKPGRTEIVACRPWLEAELDAIRPEVLVCLGATASQAVIGADFRLMERRGKFLKTSLAPKLLATLHPSAILRAPDEVGRDRLYGLLLTDLRLVASQLRGTRAGRRGRRRLA